ncbi:MAG: serine/threonine-protein kinase [Verrucomicrobiae bacterium]|nr:serine/threonine-protein kinase [Verrucomicrobiae bacterium]NNJ43019.1 serine/threonine protein kinase [Akkermansiaceae bacterium]
MDKAIEELFCELMDMPLHQRVSALEQMEQLSQDDKLTLRTMLSDAQQAESYFSATSAAVKMLPNSSHIEGAGDMCGPYQLISKLGEGGFGFVWLAKQEKPLKREVALKVIKAGMDTSEVLARFDAEKQALARMDHANIAKVLDAGMTEMGRPFFVMELVEGISITDYCREYGLDLKQRLELFRDICEAVGHAHQKGIIHRDIKPSNVIVRQTESGPLVKVIDFGIAKAIEGDLTEHTLFTKVENWVGTPTYMSPEQASVVSRDVDTRSDIYSLGVLLYELIAGLPPFDTKALMKAGYEEMRRIIREVDPPRPSTRITSCESPTKREFSEKNTAHHDGIKSIKSELDWIIMKAMDKAKERRYETAAALADEVERFLNDEPVLAKPPSILYSFGKIARRHRGLLKVAIIITVTLIGATVYSSYQAIRASKAETLAEQRAEEAVADRNAKERALEEAEAVARLLGSVLQSPQPGVDGRSVTVMQALDSAAIKLEKELVTQPERRAALRSVLAETYERLGIFERSFEMRKQDFEFQKKNFGTNHIQTRQALRKLVETTEAKGDSKTALDYANLENEINDEHGATRKQVEAAMRSQIRGLFGVGERGQAIERHRELVAYCAEAFGKESQQYAKAIWELRQYEARSLKSSTDNTDSRIDKRIIELETGFARMIQDHGYTHPETLEVQVKLASSLAKEGYTIEALQHLKSIQPIILEKYGPQDDRTLGVQSQLVWVYVKLSELVKAVRIQQAIVAARRERDGGEAKSTINAENTLERRLLYARLVNEREAYLEDLLERRTKLFGKDHIHTAVIRMHLAHKGEQLEEEIENTIRVISAHYGEKSRTAADAIAALARTFVKQKKVKEALPLYAQCGPNMRDDTWLNFELAALQIWFRDLEGYRNTRRYMLAYWERKVGVQRSRAEMFDRAMWLCSLADYDDENQKDTIEKMLEYTAIMRKNRHIEAQDRHSQTLQKQLHGIVLFRLGRHEEAMAMHQEVVRVMSSSKFQKSRYDYQLSLPLIYFTMAMTQHRMGNTEEAHRMFKSGESLLRIKQKSEENPHLPYFTGGHGLIHWISQRESQEMLGR